MKTLRVLGLLIAWSLSLTSLYARQFNLEFSVVGTGGGMTTVGPDTLMTTLGQPLIGQSTLDTNVNSSGFFFQLSGGPTGLTSGIYSYSDKWNMVSVPHTMGDFSKTVLFPTAVSSAFAYNGAYVTVSTLANGQGYWLKFNGPQNISLTGATRYRDTLTVNVGWNMIGSISSSVPVSGIVSIPPGVTTSNFFNFQGIYVSSSTIDPGKAYWVKVNQPARLVLVSSGAGPMAGRTISIQPGTEPPPPAPEGSVIEKEIPKEFALHQNYPNPFNPSTTIQYDVPSGAHVLLSVYNALGQRVATLVDEFQDAGFRTVVWDASALSSGVYVYRMSAGGFVDVKRMLIIK